MAERGLPAGAVPPCAALPSWEDAGRRCPLNLGGGQVTEVSVGGADEGAKRIGGGQRDDI